MIERFVIAALFVGFAATVGLAIKYLAGRRSRKLAGSVSLPVSSDHSPRLLVFTSKWCSDCVTQHSVIEQSRERWDRPVEISYHDAVTEGEFAKQFGIMMVPAIVIARANGAIVSVRQGLVDEDRLRSLIEAAA